MECPSAELPTDLVTYPSNEVPEVWCDVIKFMLITFPTPIFFQGLLHTGQSHQPHANKVSPTSV
jgi:hypothetical protein